MEPLPFDKLVIKGTHNSYVCNSGGWWSMTPPWMNHPPEIQIDDFGVWVIELDVGIVMEDGQVKVAVGHNGPGHATCWGHRLKEDYLEKIAKTQALLYRPVLIVFDPKTHEEQEDWPDLGWTAQEIGAKAEAVLEEVFGRENIMNGEDLNDFLKQHNRYPTIPELAGKVVLYMSNATHADECTSLEAVENSIKYGVGLYEGKAVKVVVVSSGSISIKLIGHSNMVFLLIRWWLMQRRTNHGQFSIRLGRIGSAIMEMCGNGRWYMSKVPIGSPTKR